jgi:hypothetical protein
MPYKIIALKYINMQRKMIHNKIRRRGNVAPFPLKTLFEKNKN